MLTEIRAKKNLFNNGQCFTRDKRYQITSISPINSTYDLIHISTTNDLGQPHIIGVWHKDFEIINDEN